MTFTEMAVRYRNIGKPKKCTFIFCADHGVSEMNVSAYPKSTTASMVKNYLINQGGAANAFANFTRSELVVVDVGVDADLSKVPGLVNRKIARGTKNFTEGAAMTLAQAKKSIQIGKDLAEKAIEAGCNCFLIGEMGISNTTAAAAITSTFLNVHPRKVTGRGSNISDKKLKEKIKVVKKALEVNKPNPDDALDVLAKVGGFEFGAMAGVILAAAKKNCIVILDGFNSTAAALIADAINPEVTKKLIASHRGREIGHLLALEFLGLYPIFKLDLALAILKTTSTATLQTSGKMNLTAQKLLLICLTKLVCLTFRTSTSWRILKTILKTLSANRYRLKSLMLTFNSAQKAALKVLKLHSVLKILIFLAPTQCLSERWAEKMMILSPRLTRLLIFILRQCQNFIQRQ